MSESLRAIILQELRAKFPSSDWRIGSLARELVVEPLAKIAETFKQHIQKLEASLDLDTILAEPANHEDELDIWMNRLLISSPKSTSGRGKISIVLEKPVDMKIPANTVVTWGDYVDLQVSKDYEFGINAKNNYTILGPETYEAVVEVETIGESSISLSAGEPLNWDEAPIEVYDIRTSTNITGGRTILSAQDKANLVRAALTVESFTGEDCITGALQRQFPGDVINCISGPKYSDKPHVVNIYVKSANPPMEFSKSAKAQLDGENNTYCVINSSGVLGIKGALDESGLPLVISHADELDAGTETVKIYIPKAVVGSEVTVLLTGFQLYDPCESWLNKGQQCLPFVYNILPPCVCIVRVALNIVDPSVPLEAKDELQRYINAKPLDSGLGDIEINAILNKYDITISGSHVYSATYYNNDNKSYSTSTYVGGITNNGSHLKDGRPVAMYTFIDKITLV